MSPRGPRSMTRSAYGWWCGLTEGFTTVEPTCPPGEMPTARSERDGHWEWYMAFPHPAYGQMVEYYDRMAGVEAGAHEAEATIPVRLAGRNATIGFSVRTNDRGDTELALRFPEASGAGAD